MTSGNNAISRDVDNGGGTYSSTSNNKMTGSAAEEVAFSTSSTANNLLRSGFSTIAYYPGTFLATTPLTAGAGVSASSATLTWGTPGYDGNIGAALAGSVYLVQIASQVSIGDFNNLNTITVTISTSGTAVGTSVGTGATGLDPNTTYYSQVFLRDSDGNVSAPFSTDYATFTTLATAPTVGALEFLSVQQTSVTVAWIAPYSLAVDSRTNEGYVLQGSSNNFGALAPAGAPVFSSTTFSAQASTLTIGAGGVPLDLSNTYYFQVGSLNWAGQPNYTTFTRLNFQILTSTGLIHLGTIDPQVALSTVSTSSMVVTNVGNWPATIELTASTSTAGNPWGLSTSSGVETAALLGVWNAGVGGPPALGPPPTLFNTFLTTNTMISSIGSPGNYQGGQNGVQLAPGANITLWFQFFLPTRTASVGPETISVQSQAVYP
jgi:hypothetical protein